MYIMEDPLLAGMLVCEAALRAVGELWGGRKGSERPWLGTGWAVGLHLKPRWDNVLRRGQGADRFVTLQAIHGSLITLGFDSLSCALIWKDSEGNQQQHNGRSIRTPWSWQVDWWWVCNKLWCLSEPFWRGLGFFKHAQRRSTPCCHCTDTKTMGLQWVRRLDFMGAGYTYLLVSSSCSGLGTSRLARHAVTTMAGGGARCLPVPAGSMSWCLARLPALRHRQWRRMVSL